MSFRKYQKDLEQKREEREILSELQSTVTLLTKRRDESAAKAREELRKGNEKSFSAAVSRLKNEMFCLAQAKDMLNNYQRACELRNMQSVSKKFDSSFRAIMREITGRSGGASEELKKLFKSNSFTFESSVGSLSDISDEEVRSLLEAEIRREDENFEDTLRKLERELGIEHFERPSAPPEEFRKEKEPLFEDIIRFPEEHFPEQVTELPPLTEVEEEPISPALPVGVGGYLEAPEPSEKESKEERPAENIFSYDGEEVTSFPLSILSDREDRAKIREENERDIEEIVSVLEEKLRDFGIAVKTERTCVGALFSRIEMRLLGTTTLAQVKRIEKDIAMALKRSVRLLLPIEGKDLIGVEVENARAEIIPVKELLLQGTKEGEIKIGLGFDLTYQPCYKSLDSLPHLLVGGTTGSGKSNFLHSVIAGLLYFYSPREVRLILVDFKRVELGRYQGIPHLVGGKIVDEQEEAFQMFGELSEEMDRRYKLFASCGVRDIAAYHAKIGELPAIVAIVDEYGDLVGSGYEKQIEKLIQRLAQKARACGIHLILSTQRPSVKVLSGVIKANFPTRIAFSVASHVDSTNILDASGAEDLIGKGDMLFSRGNKIERLQTPFVSEEDIQSIVDYFNH